MESKQSPRVLHVGHWCLDHVIRIQHSVAPDMIIPIPRIVRRIGGSILFAIVAANLGADVTSVTVVGDDPTAEDLRAHLNSRRVRLVASVRHGAESPETVLIESSEGWRTALTAPGVAELMTQADLSLDQPFPVEIVHYGYPYLTGAFDWQSLALEVVNTATTLHVIDLNGAESAATNPLLLPDGIPLIVKGNASEWRAVYRTANWEDACSRAVESGALLSIVTFGSLGSCAIAAPGRAWASRLGISAARSWSPPPLRVNYASNQALSGSVVGAGDAFTAGLVLELARQVAEKDGADLWKALDAGIQSARDWILHDARIATIGAE